MLLPLDKLKTLKFYVNYSFKYIGKGNGISVLIFTEGDRWCSILRVAIALNVKLSMS
ncbi:hypothetical protein METHB2_220050 [Candidatus Methylobacter favarea]|uniref:Uncharacterized protein n=1 Tax=Candidatus Methylobacter favarea TaxID=2707345 RepID=A0A8S0X000_9GAMM|nr:hypothetical protein METHB2_220050 [Candidatus Methylobacter favarea]